MVTFTTTRFREGEGAEPDVDLAWDTTYDESGQHLDWRIAPLTTVSNPGGLVANRALDTAIMIQLATWRRADPGDLPPDEDPKGWWGDTVDLEDDEQPLGSKLWLLYRGKLDASVEALAIQYTQQALQPIVKQGAVVRFDVTAEVRQVQGVLSLTVKGYSQDGRLKYSQRFARLWQQEFASIEGPR